MIRQKVTVLSADGKLVAAAGTRDVRVLLSVQKQSVFSMSIQLSLLHFPSLEPAATSIHLPKGEIYDATFSPKTVRARTFTRGRAH